MNESIAEISTSLSTVAVCSSELLDRCKLLCEELALHLYSVTATSCRIGTVPPLASGSRLHATGLHLAAIEMVPLLEEYVHMLTLQSNRARNCHLDVSAETKSYPRALELRRQRLLNRDTQVLHTSEFDGLLSSYKEALLHVTMWLERHGPSFASCARQGILGRTLTGKRLSHALQQKLFEWTIQREARQLADVSMATLPPMPTITRVDDLHALIHSRTAESDRLRKQIEDENQHLINEQAFVDNLLADVDTLESAVDAISRKADHAEETLQATMGHLHSQVSVEAMAALRGLRQERDRCLSRVTLAQERVAVLQEVLDEAYRRHPAHSRIEALERQEIGATLHMLQFASMERRVPHKRLFPIHDGNIADETNDPFTRLWLRGDLSFPLNAHLPPIAILQDLETGAILRCIRRSPPAPVIMEQHEDRPHAFILRHPQLCACTVLVTQVS
jgi:hypothetical protein